MGEIGNRKIVVLIDCGASHNFIATNLVQELKIPIISTPTYYVEVGDGHKIKCMEVSQGVVLKLQGLKI